MGKFGKKTNSGLKQGNRARPYNQPYAGLARSFIYDVDRPGFTCCESEYGAKFRHQWGHLHSFEVRTSIA